MTPGLYLLEAPWRLTDAELQKGMAQLPGHRRLKAQAQLTPLGKRQSVSAWLLLRYALRRLGLVDDGEIVTGIAGKPAFADSSMPCFSLSHCRHAVACAVAATPVGVDVEDYESYCQEVAREVLSDTELASAEGNPRKFAELWTLKESLLKQTGEGLTENLRELLRHKPENLEFLTFHGNAPYALSICGIGGDISGLTPVFLSADELID